MRLGQIGGAQSPEDMQLDQICCVQSPYDHQTVYGKEVVGL